MFRIDKKDFTYPGLSSTFRLQVDEFTISPGEIVFLHGRSGCGKTTLLNFLSGVLESTIVTECRQAFGSVGYVMHESTLLPWLTIEKNLRVEAKLRNKKNHIDKFLNLCERFGLEKREIKKRPPELSLGMRQRIEIAKALSFNHGLLLLDEALSGLDAPTKKEVAKELWEEVENNSTSVVGTAHQIGDLLMLAHRIYLIDGGRIGEVLDIDTPVTDRLNMEVERLYKLKSAEVLLKRA